MCAEMCIEAVSQSSFKFRQSLLAIVAQERIVMLTIMVTGEQPGHRAAVSPAAESPVAGRPAVGGAGLCPAQVPAHPSVLH